MTVGESHLTISSKLKIFFSSNISPHSSLSRNLACKHVMCEAVHSRMLIATSFETAHHKDQKTKNKMTFMSSDKRLGNTWQFLQGSSMKLIAWMRQFPVSLIHGLARKGKFHMILFCTEKKINLNFEIFTVHLLMGGGIND